VYQTQTDSIRGNHATQGLFAALVGDAAPADLRGTAFGLFNVANGLALLGASIIAGGLWSSIGPNATFLAGAAFAVVSGCGLLGAAGWPKKPASM
jgi:MFS family permease